MYEYVFYTQEHEANEYMDYLDEHGPDATIDYIASLYHGLGSHECGTLPLAGTGDHKYEKDGYILNWNTSLPYIGLAWEWS